MRYYYFLFYEWNLRLKPYYSSLIIQFKRIYFYLKIYHYIFKGIKFKIGNSKY